jgi:zinc transport system substrate-binding protein
MLLLIVACGEPEATRAPVRVRERPLVYTTFYPTTYLAQRIGADLVEVVCPLPGDADPIFWLPDAETVGAYQEADLIVVNGAGLEKWLEKVSLPLGKLVFAARPFEARFLRYEDRVTHSHGKGGEHAHEGLDGHTWLDPRNARVQAREILKALQRLLPEHADVLQTRFDGLAADLDSLDAAFSELGELPEGLSLYASHPAYNYLARRYGWQVVNLDLDPEEMPDAATLARLGERIDVMPARFLLWESTPNPEVAARIKSVLGLKSIVFSPCETAPEPGDYLAVMRDNIERLRPAFRKTG